MCFPCAAACWYQVGGMVDVRSIKQSCSPRAGMIQPLATPFVRRMASEEAPDSLIVLLHCYVQY